jgi:hypothetical protein
MNAAPSAASSAPHVSHAAFIASAIVDAGYA